VSQTLREAPGSAGALLGSSSSIARVPVYFPSDSTGMSAETMGHALLIQLHDLRFERHLIPSSPPLGEAWRVVAVLLSLPWLEVKEKA
jgi:hypothetical protein